MPMADATSAVIAARQLYRAPVVAAPKNRKS
jgi:hypothetical protein